MRVGWVYQKYDEPGRLAQEALREITKSEVGHEQLRGLAGPNDIIQLVASGPEWLLWAKGLALAVGAPFVAQLGKNAADDLWKRKSAIAGWIASEAAKPYRKLVMALAGAKALGAGVTVAVPLNVPFRGYLKR